MKLTYFSFDAFNEGIQKYQAFVQAWNDLQAVPSYVERCQRSAQREQNNDNRMFRGEKCDSCNHTYCTCEE